MKKILRISTVTPVYAGAAYLEELILKIDEVRSLWETAGYPFQICESLFVNDNAIDNSAEVLEKMASRFPWVKVITNSRNFGQHPATIAGILHSAGDWIVTLDEDLQHDPGAIERILEIAILGKLDIVYARPADSVHQSRLRDWGSVYFKKALSTLTGNKSIPYFNSYRLIRGSIARSAASVCSHETFFDIALSWFTNRIHSVMLEMKDLRFITTGSSGYNFSRLLSHARRMLVSSQTKILRLGALIGFCVMILDFLLGAWLFIQKITHPDDPTIRGWTSLFLAILFFGGVSLFMASVILEYLTGVVLHIQGKPTFFIVDRSLDADAADFFKKRLS